MSAFLRRTTLGIGVAIGVAGAIGVALSPAPSLPRAATADPQIAIPAAPSAAVHQPQVVANVLPEPVPVAPPVAPEPATGHPAPFSQVSLPASVTALPWEITPPTPQAYLVSTTAPAPPVEPAEELPIRAPQVQPVATQVPAEPIPAPAVSPVRRTAEGDDKLTVNVQNTDIREVLQLLSAQGGLNILASKNVTGEVSANMTGVSVETALAAILRSTGYVVRREANIIYVGTPTDLEQMDQAADRLLTRVYRPNYVAALDLSTLITPLLTPNAGKVTVSSPSEVDIPADQVKTGGNKFSGNEVVIVRDYESVVKMIDQVVAEVDVRPQQLSIEAMILSVKLNDQNKLGVNWQLLRNQANLKLLVGASPTNLATVTGSDGTLKVAFLDSSLGSLVDALETVGETNVIASPRLMVLNKQRAEIQIGEQLGYVNTTVTENASTQSVSFLEVGTLLRMRPFIGTDGLIRLEVHPELSTGNVTVQSGLTLPNKSVTQVTTNVMCRDGNTVVLGGLLREDLKNDTKQLPFLGSVPIVGALFRNRTEVVERNEIIVLITPRLVCDPMLNEEGQRLGNEFVQRQEVFFDKMNPAGRRQRGEYFYRLAKAAHAAGDDEVALKHINASLHYDSQSRDAINLRNEIVATGGYENESVRDYLRQGLFPERRSYVDYSKQGAPWKDGPAFDGVAPASATQEMGVPTPKRSIERRAPVPR